MAYKGNQNYKVSGVHSSHTHTHVHTHTRTQIHTRAHTHTHAYKHRIQYLKYAATLTRLPPLLAIQQQTTEHRAATQRQQQQQKQQQQQQLAIKLQTVMQLQLLLPQHLRGKGRKRGVKGWMKSRLSC